MPEEILTALGRLEAKIENLSDQMEIICEYKDQLITDVQEFKDYKEARKDLPQDVATLKERNATCQTICKNHWEIIEPYLKKVDFLMSWYKIGTGIVIAINILVAALVLLGRFVDFKIISP